MKRFTAIWLILALLVCFTACDANNNVDSPAMAEASTLGIDDTLKAEHFDFVILSANKTQNLKNGLGVVYAAEAEKEYVMIVFSAMNTNSETVNVMNVNFNSYVDGKKVSVQPIAGEIMGYMPLVGAVSSGKTFEGYAIWEVSVNSSVLEFSYLDALTGFESDSYVIALCEISQ